MNTEILKNILKKKYAFDRSFHDAELGGLLKERRINLNRTQDEVSHGICSVSYLSKLENAQIEPNQYVIQELASKLDIDPSISSFHEEKMAKLEDIIKAFFYKNTAEIKRLRTYLLKFEPISRLYVFIIDIILDQAISESRIDYHVKCSNTYNQFELISLIYFTAYYYYENHNFFLANNYISLIIDSHQQNLNHILNVLIHNLYTIISLYLDNYYPIKYHVLNGFLNQSMSYEIYFKLLKSKRISSYEEILINYKKTPMNDYIKFLVSKNKTMKQEWIQSLDVDPITDCLLLQKELDLDGYVPTSKLQQKSYKLHLIESREQIKMKIRDDILPFLINRGYMVYAEYYKNWIVDICVETARYKEAMSYINKIKKRRLTSL